ncbi:hypothetical protein KO317_00765 [Candidatus Micrarchaeota archaeon]|nr:hypothetical protein [Candidatus Micrarchaeota archaeon]
MSKPMKKNTNKKNNPKNKTSNKKTISKLKKPATKTIKVKKITHLKKSANSVRTKTIKKVKKSIKTQNKKLVKKTVNLKSTKPVSKMTPDERKQLAQKRLPKQKKPNKRQEEKIKESRRQFLKNPILRQKLIDLAGEHALALMQEFTYDMSDEELSRKIKAKVSEVRSTLNKLHNKGIVVYSRSKDSETGWYSYIWKFQDHKVQALLEEAVNAEEITQNVQTDHYHCLQCSSKELIPFEEAIDLKFRCPVCSMPLSYKEKNKT